MGDANDQSTNAFLIKKIFVQIPVCLCPSNIKYPTCQFEGVFRRRPKLIPTHAV